MELLFTFLSFFFFPLLLFFIYFKNKKPSKTHYPPGPSRLPIIGNLHQLEFSSLHVCLGKLSQRYGELMFLKFGSIPTLVVSSAKLAEEVLKNQDSIFCSRPNLIATQKLSYNGSDIAFAAYSQEWREMRKIGVLQLLSVKRIQQFSPIRQDEVSRMVGTIRKDAELGVVTNLTHLLMSTTCSNICRIAFGRRPGDETNIPLLLKQIQEVVTGFFFTDFFPSVGWLDHLTGMHSKLDKTCQMADEFYQKLIDEHFEPNRPESMTDDLIDIMFQLQRDETTSFKVTMDHIKAMLMNVFTAGTETAEATVIWAMTSLMKNPSALEKLQKEIRQVVGQKKMVEESDLEKMPYLTATLKETFRLYPIVPLLVPRVAMQKCKLDGYEIAPNTMVYVNVWAIGRDRKLWENADDFCPERFLTSKIDLMGQQYQLIPFGSGRRSCPGYQLGLLSVHLLLANLIHSFDWELPSGMSKEDLDTEAAPGITVSKKIPLKLAAKIHA